VSKVSAKVEHLIRAAVKGIEGSPETWNQSYWCRSDSVCGTTYCLGGWMMLYDGWKHSEARDYGGSTWFKGDLRIADPYTDFLAMLVYGDVYTYLDETIFSETLNTFDDLVGRITEDLEINFEEACPCLFEEVCDLAGCPCGAHQNLTDTVVEKPSEADPQLVEAINKFVGACRDDGDNVTVEQVLSDRNMIALLGAVFQAGAHSVVAEVTSKADRRIAEINHELQLLRADSTTLEVKQLRETVASLQAKLNDTELGLSPWERDAVIRRLQGQVDELRDGTRRTPEFRKMKAALKKAQEDIAAMQEAQGVRAAQIRKLQVQVIKQEEIIKGSAGPDALKGRREGFQKAVESWQKALDIVKAQENL
jgi:hypothetical protein